jgi:hypothetical protein
VSVLERTGVAIALVLLTGAAGFMTVPAAAAIPVNRVGPAAIAGPAMTSPGGLSLVTHAGPSADLNFDGLTDAGDKIAYSYVVTNTSPSVLHDVRVTDAGVGAISCGGPSLAPGASEVCAPDGLYTVSSSDVIAGAVVDHARASARTSAGRLVESAPATVTTPTADAHVALRLNVSATPVPVAASGDTMTIALAVTNVGNVTVTSIGIDSVDGLDSVDPHGDRFADCRPPALAPGQTMVCVESAPVTAADVSAGVLSDTAVADGFNPAGLPYTSNSSSAAISITAAASSTAAGTSIAVPQLARPALFSAPGPVPATGPSRNVAMPDQPTQLSAPELLIVVLVLLVGGVLLLLVAGYRGPRR